MSWFKDRLRPMFYIRLFRIFIRDCFYLYRGNMNRATWFRSFIYMMSALVGCTPAAWANHGRIYGADLGYEHISGTTYRIKLRIYATCADHTDPVFTNGRPLISIFGNKIGLVDSIILTRSGSGTKHWQACPAIAGMSGCADPNSPPGLAGRNRLLVQEMIRFKRANVAGAPAVFVIRAAFSAPGTTDSSQNSRI